MHDLHSGKLLSYRTVGLGASGPGILCVWRELFRVLFQHGGHAGLITAATRLVRRDCAFFKAQSDQNLAWFFCGPRY